MYSTSGSTGSLLVWYNRQAVWASHFCVSDSIIITNDSFPSCEFSIAECSMDLKTAGVDVGTFAPPYPSSPALHDANGHVVFNYAFDKVIIAPNEVVHYSG